MTDYEFAHRNQLIDSWGQAWGLNTWANDWQPPRRSRFTPLQVIALSLRRASELPEEILREIMRHVMTIRRRTMNRRIRTGEPEGPEGPAPLSTFMGPDTAAWLWKNTNWSRHYRGWSGTSRQRRRAWQVKVITRKWDPRQPGFFGILEALMPNLKL